MRRAEVLKAAGEAVVDRGLNYGQPEDNFANIARMWNAHLVNRGLLKYPAGIEPHDVALMMANVKQVRISCDPNHVDSWVDFTGYGACGAEVAHAGTREELAATVLVKRPSEWVVEIAPANLRHEPETKFGFTVGETVNLAISRLGVKPGKVESFDGGSVHVLWEGNSSVSSVPPHELRHGP